MPDPKERRFAHTDLDLLRARMKLTPGQRLQAMLNAHAVMVGVIRGRLRPRYPDLSERALNLKVIEEIERAKRLPSRSHALSRHSS